MRQRKAHHSFFLMLVIGACGLHWMLVVEKLIYKDNLSHKEPSALKLIQSLHSATPNMPLNDTLLACAEWMPRATEQFVTWTDKPWEEFVCTRPAVIPPRVCSTDRNSGHINTLIAILAGVSTRGVTWTTPTQLAPFRHLLPSIVKTVDCGFRYEVILGYDRGDAFYDTPIGREVTLRWFQTHVQDALAKSHIEITLVLKKVENKVQKPGPVFNDIARVAYSRGADYVYRVNDDSEFLNPWAYKFVRTLQGMGQPYGVVGPWCNQSNTKILNHDFTHRTHMDIFEDYYPSMLTDWYLDDWISMVYGSTRTRQFANVEILHHTRSQNVRYTVDYYRREYLEDLVVKGKGKILEYMMVHDVPPDEIQAFNESRPGEFPIQRAK